MAHLVTGGAGFVGANLIGRLLASGAAVVAADNFVRGARANLASLANEPGLRVVEADLATAEGCAEAFAAAADLGPIEAVWHLAANSDIPAGVADPGVDLRDTFLTTFETVRAMRAAGVKRLLFASSSAIYGDLGDAELCEESGPLHPISYYGAMKLASEALASAAAEDFLDQALILRFPNVVGVPSTHGVILDFIRRLRTEPEVLRVLGDGTQRKPYLHAGELIDAMLLAQRVAPAGVQAYNIGPADAGVTVDEIARRVVAKVSPAARIEFGDEPRGWVGDVPRFRYSTARLAALGWTPRLTSAQAIGLAIEEIARQEGC